jgi:hypothetical protein
MRIENIKPETLKAETDAELKNLRVRCAQVFSKEKMPAGLRRAEVLKKYVMLRIEMRKRRIPDPAPNWLEDEARLRIAKRAICGIDVPGLPEIILKENFAAIVGAFIKNPKTAADLEIIVKAATRDEAMEAAITKALTCECGMPSGCTYSAVGIPGPHIPLWDLVLRPKPLTFKAPAECITKDSDEKPIPDAPGPATFTPETKEAPVDGIKEFESDFGPLTEPVEKADKFLSLMMEKKAQASPISKPETTDKYHRLPVSDIKPGDKIRTMNLSPDQGIKALYDVNQKKVVAFIFDNKKWTMADAKKWVADHKRQETKKAEDPPAEMEEETGLALRIVKADKTLQIVGGIIYEPNRVDTQDDFTDTAEITKAMYGFMEGYSENPKRIKVMHQGKPYYFPILECYQPEEDTKKGKDIIKAGAWYITIKVKDPEIWDDIETGKLTAFSMGGSARKAN